MKAIDTSREGGIALALAAMAVALYLGGCATTGNAARSLGEAGPLPPPPPGLVDPSVPILRTAAGVEFVRTPEERFENLKDFPYEARYLEVDGLRLAYEDEGPADAPVVLMLHGQPDWSYLYRKMIPPITAAGYRCIALDLVGFGRSDKPVDGSIHTYEQQVAWVKAFIHGLGLQDITLFCQDWGGLIGLRIVGDEPELFARVIAANTYLPLYEKGTNPYRLPANLAVDPRATRLAAALGPAMVMGKVTVFNAWIQYSLTSPTFMPSEVMRQSRVSPMPKPQPTTRPSHRTSTKPGPARSLRCSSQLTTTMRLPGLRSGALQNRSLPWQGNVTISSAIKTSKTDSLPRCRGPKGKNMRVSMRRTLYKTI